MRDHNVAQKNSKKDWIRAKKRANDQINKNRSETKFKVGDHVTLRARNQSDALKGKISKFYSIFYGPFKIKKCLGDYSYILDDLDNQEKTGKYNIKDLQKYYKK